jgi:hypothetical protein
MVDAKQLNMFFENLPVTFEIKDFDKEIKETKVLI